MNNFKKVIFVFLIISVLLAAFSFGSFAENEKLDDNKGGVIVMSHRGNGTGYPSNSLEAVCAAAELGAQMISVSVQMPPDGVLVLAENVEFSEFSPEIQEAMNQGLYSVDLSVLECSHPTLEETIKSLDGKAVLVIDNAWEYRDEISELVNSLGASDCVMLRTFESAKNIIRWKSESKSNLSVIGIYDGAVIFNAISHLEKLSEAGEKLVQYQSKNYFNVMYGSLTANRFSKGDNAGAIAPMYEKDLCGQRNDNIVGWDEMLDRGFSVIETNLIEELLDYQAQNEKSFESLSGLIEDAEKIDLQPYSSVSVKNFKKALESAKLICENKNSSLGAKQEAYSDLFGAMDRFGLKSENDVQKGSLNVTPGKIAAVVIFGALILAAQVYVYKMKKKIR